MIRPCSALLLPVLLAGCAQMRDLSGGEKDVLAPALLSSSPADRSTHFDQRRFELTFDERVKVNNARQQLLISPPLTQSPEVSVKGGRTVVVDLKEDLLPNTTYSFNFGSSIVDLTEGNPALDLTYVVSTGAQLDSGLVEGRVLDAWSGRPAADMPVLLYEAGDTAGFRSGRPLYAGRSASDGAFRLRNLRTGSYRLYALRDQNANLRYDLPNEDIAFLEAPVPVPAGGAAVLWSFRELPSTQQVMDQRVGADRDWRFVLALPAKDLRLRDIDRTGGILSWSTELNATRDSVRLWPNDTTAIEGTRFELSDGATVLDTFTYRVREKMPYLLGISMLRTGDTLDLMASRPLEVVDTALIDLRTEEEERGFRAWIDPQHDRVLHLLPQGPVGERYTLRFEPKALTDLYRGGNDTLVFTVRRRPGTDQGTVRLDLVTDSLDTAGPWMLQVLDPQDHVVRSMRSVNWPRPVLIEALEPGSYQLKLVLDRNANGRQDTGDLARGIAPEPAWRWSGPLVVRAGWLVEQHWSPQMP